MSTHLEFVLFTVGPLFVLGSMVLYSLVAIYRIDDRRPLLLLVLLLFMSVHQVTEVLQFASGTYAQTLNPPAETFESGANLLASVASYLVLQQISELRGMKAELEISKATVEERSSMVSVLNRILRHNVRNEINTIAGNATYVREQRPDDRFDDELRTIEETALRLAEISDRTQRIRQLLIEAPTKTIRIDLRAYLESPIQKVDADASDASIALNVATEDDVTVETPSSFPAAVADVVERILAANSGSVHVGVTVTRRGGSVVVVIDDDGDGLPELDKRAIESEEETPLNHAEGLSLWCLEWVVRRAGGDLDPRPDDATVEIRLPVVD